MTADVSSLLERRLLRKLSAADRYELALYEQRRSESSAAFVRGFEDGLQRQAQAYLEGFDDALDEGDRRLERRARWRLARPRRWLAGWLRQAAEWVDS